LPRDDGDSWPQTPAALLEAMRPCDNRVPQELFAAAAAQGEAMLDTLSAYLGRNEQEDDGSWLLLHAFHLAGVIAGETAGRLLLRLLRRLAALDEGAYLDWADGSLTDAFIGRPQCVLDEARRMAASPAEDQYLRSHLVDGLVGAAWRTGPEALEAALDWVAVLARTAHESDPEFGHLLACSLLDYPRERHRALLESWAAAQAGEHWTIRIFLPPEVEAAFMHGADKPPPSHHRAIGEYYSPEAVARRQRLVDDGAAQIDADDWDADDWDAGESPPQPYFRPAPKRGRNEPCHCGSGRKYKKCCLAADAALAAQPRGGA
jgi:hypothetical protein